MRRLQSNEVFKPSAFPEHTYVSRKSLIGSDFKNPEDFWATVGRKSGLTFETEHTQLQSLKRQRCQIKKSEIRL